MTLSKFYDLISRAAEVTLAKANSKKPEFKGCVKEIPDEYNTRIVKDFTMHSDGSLTFILK